ncbi:MAG TPA: sigma-54 dependent transcriptional regulator [Terriglobales bacterium]
MQVVVIDDDPATCSFLQAAFSAQGHGCDTFLRSSEAKDFIASRRVDLVLIDVYLGAESGLDVLQQLKSTDQSFYAVIMTAHITLETASESVKQGALEYLSKPISMQQIRDLIRRVHEYLEQKKIEIPLPPPPPGPKSSIVGRSPKMLEVYNAVGRVAPSNVSVLITGASGTGKELIARAIHQHSPRSLRPFTAVNCGALTETILESELFGYEKGAFTGADTSRHGLFEATDGGTLFLDEVSETSLSFQVKLLRVLQEQQIRRVGSTRFIPVDVRIIAASNRKLQELLKEGRFREDLYYRLSVVQITMPSLEERQEDIPLLVTEFLREFNRANSQNVTMDAAAMDALQSLDWPGNVRELENAVKRLAIFARTGRVTASDVKALREPAPKAPDANAASDRLLDLERSAIVRVLQETDGNKAEAARRLGIERKTLYKKALRLGIDLQGPERQ